MKNLLFVVCNLLRLVLVICKSSELNFDRLSFRSFFIYVKEFSCGKAERRRHHIGRKDLQFGVEVADVAVVKSARGLDFVFRVRQVALQREKIFIGF